jgi:hypothetical protein
MLYRLKSYRPWFALVFGALLITMTSTFLA